MRSQKDGKLYIGSTEDSKRRFKEHNFGRTGYTKLKRPWKLVYKEEFKTKKEAIKRERYLKRLKSKKYLESLITKKSRS